MAAILNFNNLETTDLKIHFVPAEIQHNGQANVASYFESTIRDVKPEKKIASLRGRPLNGDLVDVPSGYTGVLVTETRKRFTEDEERELTGSQSFKSFCNWNLDREPSKEDKLQQALNWASVAKALHEPLDSSDSQGSLKSEPSM